VCINAQLILMRSRVNPPYCFQNVTFLIS